jgi:membrane protease YdiL (CAAX protease family)
MMDTQLNTKRILIFLAFAFAIPWAAALAFYLTGSLENNVNLFNYLIVIPAPALANVATRLITRQGWGHLWLRPNFRRGWRAYLALWLLPLLAAIVGGGIYYLLFPQSFDPNFGEMRKLLSGSPSALAYNVWTLLLIQIVQSIIIAVPLYTFIAIGEEFGWRAYLLQRLMDRFSSADNPSAGARKAALLVGVIWGVWHWPLFFMGVGVDNTYPGAPFLYPLVYLVSTCSLSVLLSWGTLRSGSVWPAAIGHGAIKPYTMLVAAFPLKGLASLLLGPGFDGLIGGLGFLALALVLLFSRRAFAAEKEARSERMPAMAITNPG